MQPQRQVRPDPRPSASAGAPRIGGALGGTVGEWQRLLDYHFAERAPVGRAELAIEAVSRWSGPVVFALALAGLIYAL